MKQILKEQKLLEYKGKTISYELSLKKVKNINLRIRANGSVAVSANNRVSQKQINDFIYKNAEYILMHIGKFNQNQEYNTPKLYVSEEIFWLLGKNLKLNVVQANKEIAFSDGVYLHLSVKNKDDFEKKQKIIKCFFDEQCKEEFEKSALEMFPIFSKYGVKMPVIKTRAMKTRWGSCLPKKGVITLNKHLIEKPRKCLEYVVMHEFCHFIHPNHSKQFYSLLSALMPDWKERKRILKAYQNKNLE